jgi:DNA-binding IclR family transcriptional regulator
MKTYEKVIEALRDGEQSPEEIAVNAMLPAPQVSSSLRTLQNRGMVDWQEDQGRRVYRLTGVGL